MHMEAVQRMSPGAGDAAKVVVEMLINYYNSRGLKLPGQAGKRDTVTTGIDF